MPAPISPDVAKAIQDATRAGKSRRSIADEFNVSISTASLYGRMDGAPPLPPRPQAKPKTFDDILSSLKKTPQTIEAIAESIGNNPEDVRSWITEKRAHGVNLLVLNSGLVSFEAKPAQKPFGHPILDVMSAADDTFTIGAMGDTHLASKYERLDVLNSLYDQYEREGVSHVFHTGNWVDGEARFNKHDLIVHGMERQLQYLAEKYPRRPGIATYAVAGDDHEGWWCQREGVDIGRYAERIMRDHDHDWTDLGYMEAFVRLVNVNTGKHSMLHVVHPGGGSAYATSYTVQKIVESYGGGEKPAVLLAGHYHKMEFLNVRNVWCVQTGTTQDQTPFMRKKKLEAHIGGHVLRLKQDPATGAIISMNGMYRYFDRGYYNNRWSMSGDVTHPPATLNGVNP